MVVFFVEYLLRLVAANNRIKFVKGTLAAAGLGFAARLTARQAPSTSSTSSALRPSSWSALCDLM
jgi:hypothetical protein